MSFAEAYGGTVVSFFNRFGPYEGMGIFLFPDILKATAHSVHVMSTGTFLKLECERLLTSAEYKKALTISQDARSSYQPPHFRFGRSGTE